MRQVKAYVELQNYQEITGFAEAERVVSSYVVTNAIGVLAARVLTDLAAPRGTNTDTPLPALQIITGQRGTGKSHFLAFLRTLIGVKTLRGLVADSNLLTALGLFGDKMVTTVAINFTDAEQAPFATCLRQALCDTLKHASYFDDEKWAAAVQGEQVFEQALGALPLGSQLILFIDNMPHRWRVAPETVEDDLNWLALIARQSNALPLRAVIVRDEEVGENDTSDSAVYSLPPDSAQEIISRRVLRKSSAQLRELEDLYNELGQLLPGYSWSKEEFVRCYPVHPLIYECAAAFRAAAQSFSLPNFVATSVTRVLSRPATSLITPDEVFDRYEYEFRKNQTLASSFKLYDQIVTQAIAKLPVSERLWAKLALKTLFAFSLNGQPATAQQIAQAQMLTDETNPQAAYERVTTILTHFATTCPDALLPTGSGNNCSYLLASVHQAVGITLERQLTEAARDIAPNDARLLALLFAIGLEHFQDEPSNLESQVATSAFSSSALPSSWTQSFSWRGSLRSIEVCLGENDSTESQWRLVIAPPSEDAAGISDSQLDEYTVVWRPAVVSGPLFLHPLKKLLVLQELTQARLAEGVSLSEDYRATREKLTEQVRELFRELYLAKGMLSNCEYTFAVTSFVTERTFTGFLGHAFDALLSRHFPQHPPFVEPLTIPLMQQLIGAFFLGTEEQRIAPEVQQLAAQFAAPLGLASAATSSAPPQYEPDIFSEAVQAYPFVQAVLSFIDEHTDESGLAQVPLILLERLLSDVPYGLSYATQHLLFGGLIATNLVELLNEESSQEVTRANLTPDFSLDRFTAVRRVAAISYPPNVLAEWARLLTGQVDLPALITLEGERRVREAVGRWLASWHTEELNARFEQLPMDMLTLSAWRALNASKLRFARVSALAEAIAEGTMEIKTALSRIADIFGLDRMALARMQDEMRALSRFLDWIPSFTELRNYLLAAESTSDFSIEGMRAALTTEIQDAPTLLDTEMRRHLEVKFAEFRKCYSEFYAAAHEAEVGPTANRQLISSFCVSPEWTKFRLLMELRMESGAFERDAQALLKLAQETRCDLPVLELLQHQPHCCCSFRLHRQVQLSTLLDALKAIVSAASTFYSLAIWRQRNELRTRAKELSDENFQAELEDFLTACGSGDLSDLNADLVSFINECLLNQPQSASASLS
ncbi:MAG TPA: hypothetical protein VFZ34_12295 [Blastocatellia bacterium]|nr:hypothetical protein [Blastocatellia bacterium]